LIRNFEDLQIIRPLLGYYSKPDNCIFQPKSEGYTHQFHQIKERKRTFLQPQSVELAICAANLLQNKLSTEIINYAFD
jgi:hypothetical protein